MNSRTTRTTALALALAAAAAPAVSPMSAGADPASSVTNRTPAAVYSRQDKSMIPAAAVATTVNVPHPVIRIQAPNGGFDWGDAGIGAAGGLALALVGVGGVLILTEHPARRTRNTTPTPR